jgi:hypothetical protein
VIEARNLKYIGELPGSGPWRIVMFKGNPVFVSPNEAPHMIIDGKAVAVGSDAIGKQFIEVAEQLKSR